MCLSDQVGMIVRRCQKSLGAFRVARYVQSIQVSPKVSRCLLGQVGILESVGVNSLQALLETPGIYICIEYIGVFQSHSVSIEPGPDARVSRQRVGVFKNPQLFKFVQSIGVPQSHQCLRCRTSQESLQKRAPISDDKMLPPIVAKLRRDCLGRIKGCCLVRGRIFSEGN